MATLSVLTANYLIIIDSSSYMPAAAAFREKEQKPAEKERRGERENGTSLGEKISNGSNFSVSTQAGCWFSPHCKYILLYIVAIL